MGHGGGIDADKLDGLELSSIQGFVTSHNSNAAAHANIELDAARITSGAISNDRLNMGHGNGIDADTVDGQHASAFALLTHNHAASQITSGVLAFDRLPVGTGADQVAVGNHAHALNDLSNVNVPSPGSGDVLSWTGAQWQAAPSAASSGVSELYWSGSIQGNQTVSVNFTCDSQSSVLITCCMNHYGLINGYGCSRMSFVAIGPNLDVRDIDILATANGGSWTFTKVGNTQLTITKTAGSYVGGGYYFIKVEGANGLAKL